MVYIFRGYAALAVSFVPFFVWLLVQVLSWVWFLDRGRLESYTGFRRRCFSGDEAFLVRRFCAGVLTLLLGLVGVVVCGLYFPMSMVCVCCALPMVVGAVMMVTAHRSGDGAY